MKIGLIDVDGHNFPNLPLMKLSAYHKAQGDTVDWWNGFEHYDRVYVSRVFDDTYSAWNEPVINADEIVYGGTGFDLKNKLADEIEHIYPDYSLYPKFTKDTAYGFLTRGCPRNCGFCIVSEKEGRESRKVADLSEFWRGQKKIVLLDPNLLACSDHMDLLGQLADSGAWVDFTQGLDIRFTTPENIAVLNRIKTKMLHFAWDNPHENLTGYFQRFDELSDVKDFRKRRVYVLTNYNTVHREDLFRIYKLVELGYDPYVMVYDKPSAPRRTRHLQRWCNNKRIFRTTPRFENYDHTKG